MICLNSPDGMDVEVQLELFGHALEELAIDSDLVNQVLDITPEDDNGELQILRYKLPPERV